MFEGLNMKDHELLRKDAAAEIPPDLFEKPRSSYTHTLFGNLDMADHERLKEEALDSKEDSA